MGIVLHQFTVTSKTTNFEHLAPPSLFSLCLFFFCLFFSFDPIFAFNFFKACSGDSHRNVENDSSNTRNVHYIHITRKSPDPERAVRCMIHCLQFFCPWRLQDYRIMFCKTIFHIYIENSDIFKYFSTFQKNRISYFVFVSRARARFLKPSWRAKHKYELDRPKWLY